MKEPVLTPQKMGGALLIFEQMPEELCGPVSLRLIGPNNYGENDAPSWSFCLDDLSIEDLTILRVMTARVEGILIAQQERHRKSEAKGDPFAPT